MSIPAPRGQEAPRGAEGFVSTLVGSWRMVFGAWLMLAGFIAAVVVPLHAAGWLVGPAKDSELKQVQGTVAEVRADVAELKTMLQRLGEDVRELQWRLAATQKETPARPPARVIVKKAKPKGLFGLGPF